LPESLYWFTGILISCFFVVIVGFGLNSTLAAGYKFQNTAVSAIFAVHALIFLSVYSEAL
jgi:hypothetical protein